MADYFGLEAIGRRMHVDRRTIMRWATDHSFLMYRRRHNRRAVWYTNDELIGRWEIARCVTDVTYRRHRQMSRVGTSTPCHLDTETGTA